MTPYDDKPEFDSPRFTGDDGELPRPSDFTAPHACGYCGIQLPLLGLVLRHEERCPLRPANVLEALVQDVQARRMAGGEA